MPADQHEQVRNHLQQTVFVDDRCARRLSEGDYKDQRQRGKSSRESDPEVFAELVFHLAALSVAGGDCRVGDEGEVVAEHGAAHHDTQHKGARHPRLVRYTDGYRGQGHDRAHRRTYRDGYEASGQEDSGRQQVTGQDGHRQIHGSVYGTHRLGGLRERPGEDEDQYHQHDIAVGRPPAELLDTVA